MVFYDAPLERVTPHVFYMNFMMGFAKATLRDESQQKRFCNQVITKPTLFKDAHDYRKSCDVCQAYAQMFTVSGLLHPIPPLGPFEKWGIDLMGPLPMIKRRH
jgi:hypothetical protein